MITKKMTLGLSLVSAIALSTAAQAGHKGRHHIELKGLEKRVHDLEIGHSGKRHIHSPSGAKVTLTGQVNRALQWADSNPNSGISNIDNDVEPTMLTIRGEHHMGCHEVAGQIQVAYVDNSSLDTSVISNETGAKFEVRHAAVQYTNGKHGVITAGKWDTASEGITEIDYSGTGAASVGASVQDIGDGLIFRSGALAPANAAAAGAGSDVTFPTVGRTWDQFAGTGDRRNLVRYDSPEYYGFRASVSHGDRSSTDAALRFAGEFGGFKVGAGASYAKKGGSANVLLTTGAGGLFTFPTPLLVRGVHFTGVSGSMAILHKDTGLNVMAAGGHRSYSGGNAGSFLRDAYMWFVKAGWRGHVPVLEKWGETAVTGNYGMNEHVRINVAPVTGVQTNNNETQTFGFAVTQNVEKLSTDLYVAGQWFDHDLNGAGLADPSTIFAGVVGARVKI